MLISWRLPTLMMTSRWHGTLDTLTRGIYSPSTTGANSPIHCIPLCFSLPLTFPYHFPFPYFFFVAFLLNLVRVLEPLLAPTMGMVPCHRI